MYLPREDTAGMLQRALQMVDEVPYKVSARWLFYRLLQEGYYSGKGDYKNKFLKATSNARHAFYDGWHPDTLADETRQAITRGGGFETTSDWINALVNQGFTCSLNKWKDQDYYVELWFEARAMTAQFKEYTSYITLRPMAGQPSIPFKWEIAKDLEYYSNIVILYFGDLDPAGETIGDTVERDVRLWCDEEFTFIKCGLDLEQVALYNVPENPDKPGEYQWEALPDEGAKDIIEAAIDPYVRHDAFEEAEASEADAEAWLSERMVNLVEDWEDDH